MQATWQYTRKPISTLITGAFFFSVLALGSCKTETNRFDYKPDGTHPDGPFKPTNCVQFNQPDDLENTTILDLALGAFAFVTPASAALPRGDVRKTWSDEGVRMAGGGDGGC